MPSSGIALKRSLSISIALSTNRGKQALPEHVASGSHLLLASSANLVPFLSTPPCPSLIPRNLQLTGCFRATTSSHRTASHLRQPKAADVHWLSLLATNVELRYPKNHGTGSNYESICKTREPQQAINRHLQVLDLVHLASRTCPQLFVQL